MAALRAWRTHLGLGLGPARLPIVEREDDERHAADHYGAEGEARDPGPRDIVEVLGRRHASVFSGVLRHRSLLCRATGISRDMPCVNKPSPSHTAGSVVVVSAFGTTGLN